MCVYAGGPAPSASSQKSRSPQAASRWAGRRMLPRTPYGPGCSSGCSAAAGRPGYSPSYRAPARQEKALGPAAVCGVLEPRVLPSRDVCAKGWQKGAYTPATPSASGLGEGRTGTEWETDANSRDGGALTRVQKISVACACAGLACLFPHSRPSAHMLDL